MLTYRSASSFSVRRPRFSYYAKQIIKLINSIAYLINNDPSINDKIKIVFVENYGVSLAELIIPAPDISEQISCRQGSLRHQQHEADVEWCHHDGNIDGANVEIRDHVGEDNIFIFGLKSDEVQEYYRNGVYNSRDIYDKNPRLKRILNLLIDGMIPGVETVSAGYLRFVGHVQRRVFLAEGLDGYL